MRGALHFNLLPRHPLPFQTTCSGAAGSRLLSIFGLRGGIKELFFFTFGQKGGGLDQVEKSLLEKTEVVKKGGGGLSFLTKSKKKTVFYASSYDLKS